MPKVWISIFPYKDAAADKSALSFDMSIVILTRRNWFLPVSPFQPDIAPVRQSSPKQKLHKRKAMSTWPSHCFESSGLFQQRCWRLMGLNFVDIKHIYKISETLTFWFLWHNWFTMWICIESYVMQIHNCNWSSNSSIKTYCFPVWGLCNIVLRCSIFLNAVDVRTGQSPFGVSLSKLSFICRDCSTVYITVEWRFHWEKQAGGGFNFCLAK